MRRRITILLSALTLLSAGLHAQTGTFGAFFDKYSAVSGVRSAAVNETMLMLARTASSEIPAGIKGIKTLAIDDKSKVAKGTAESLEKELMEVVSDSVYYMLPDFAREGYDVRVYARKPAQKDKYKDVIIYIASEKVVAMELEGELGKEVEFIRKLISGK